MSVIINPGGGGVAIGSPIVGGTPTDILFADASGNLGQNTNFTYTTDSSLLGNVGSVLLTAGAAATIPLKIQGAASQSGNLLQLQNSTPAVLTVFNKLGRLGIGGSTSALGGTPGHMCQIIAGVGSNAPLMMQGGSCEMEMWKDATPTKAVAFGMAVPANAATNDLIFSLYNGSSWTNRLQVDNADGKATITYGLAMTSTAGTAASGITLGADTNLYRSAANTLFTDDNIGTAIKITTYNNVATEGYGVPSIVDHVALTAQAASIGTTNFTNAGTAGLYRVNYYLEATTLNVGATTIMLTVAWTDDAGATTTTSAALPLTALGRTSGIFYVQLASGNLTYATTLIDATGLARYALYMSCERMN